MAVEKVALITAGGTGIAAAAARRLVEDGCHIGILSSSGVGEALAQELGGVGVTGSSECLADLGRLVDLAQARWGRVDVLINSTGHEPRAPLLSLADERWMQGADTYLHSVVRPTRLVAPLMQAQRGGVIVNLSSAWAVDPSALFPTAALVRAGLASFTRIFVDSYSRHNIRMNNVLPGWIDTAAVWEERRATVPLQRYGQAAEVAATIAFLASEGAGYINGQNLRVDGGLALAT